MAAPDSPSSADTGATDVTAVIFDLGGVVLQWDPYLAFREVLPEEEIADFLTEIDFRTWNLRQDGLREWDRGEQELITRFPHRAEAIAGYRRHFERAVPAMIPGTAGVIAELGQTDLRLVALTNWAAKTFNATRTRFDVLQRFEGIVVSGEEELSKPDPRIFTLLLERFGLEPASSLFVDDSAANCAAAQALGLQAVRFTGADALREELRRRGLLDAPAPLNQPIFHLVEHDLWQQAQRTGSYPWSSRGLTYQQAGFVRCAFAEQVPVVRDRSFADLADADLDVLRLEPDQLSATVVVETLAGVGSYPHLFGPLDPRSVVRTREAGEDRSDHGSWY